MIKPDTAIIIAGGRGTRLGLNHLPKPMIQIAGKPLLQFTLDWLKANRINKVIIGVAYQKEKIINHFGDGRKLKMNIVYSVHDVDDGTGDAFRKAIENSGLTSRLFYAMNSDQITEFQLDALYKHHVSPHVAEPLATIVLVHPTCPFGIVNSQQDGTVTFFEEKPVLKEYANGGIYLFDRRIKDFLKGNVERNTFVKMARLGKLQSIKFTGFWDTVNTMKDLERIKAIMERQR
jgi:NDP-sugar pyrophosphorylase family protein